MKTKIAKLLTLGMSIALVFSLAACGGNEDGVSTEMQSTESTTTTVAAAEPATNESVSSASSEMVAENQNNQPTQAAGEDQPSGIQTPTDTAGVIALYNSAIGKAGFSGADVQLAWGGSDTTIGDLNEKTGGKVKPEFEKGYHKSVKPGSVNAGDVQSAKAKDSGNVISIEIELKNVTEAAGSGTQYGDFSYPYFITYADADELVRRCANAAAPGLTISIAEKGSKLNLYDAVITATVDKSSGEMTSLTFKFGEKVMGKAMGFVNAEIWGTGEVKFS